MNHWAIAKPLGLTGLLACIMLTACASNKPVSSVTGFSYEDTSLDIKNLPDSAKRCAYGVVFDIEREKVVGASVVVKGTTVGTPTDFEGLFYLAAAEGCTLQVSSPGYQTLEIPLKGHCELEIDLAPEGSAQASKYTYRAVAEPGREIRRQAKRNTEYSYTAPLEDK